MIITSVNQQFINIFHELKNQGTIKSNADLAKQLSITPQLLSEILANRTKISHNLLQIFCMMYGVNLYYLYYGMGPKMVTYSDGNLNGNLNGNLSDTNALSEGEKGKVSEGKVKGKVLGKVSDTNALLNKKTGMDILPGDKQALQAATGVPYYEMLPASAGNFTDVLNSAEPTSYINLPQLEGCTAVLPVYGSSMKGLIEPGDLIAIKELKSRTEFDPSVPYLVITTEQRMIKYLRADDTDPQVIWADSTNHKPFKLDPQNILFVYAIKCVIRLF